MRKLLILQGCPASGKSTWIEENNLQPYTISSDAIRLLFRPVELGADSKEHISPKCDKEVWDTIFLMLEAKMKQGQFVVIDACNISIKTLNKYNELALKYLYKVYYKRFDLPLETLYDRNKYREEYKQVPEEVIENFYNRLQEVKVPQNFVKINNFNEIGLTNEINLNGYKKVHIFGDIHGCYSALQKALPELKEDEYYIFLGDYLDRGPENKQTLQYFLSIYNKPNVSMLFGNHEEHLLTYVNNQTPHSKEFAIHTMKEIEGIDKREIKKMLKSLKDYVEFEVYAEEDSTRHYFHCSHAGVPFNRIKNIESTNILYPTEYYSQGPGEYEDIYKIYKNHITEGFTALSPFWYDSINIVNGHRNPQHCKINEYRNCYNLEGEVEWGKDLREIVIDLNPSILTVEPKYHHNDIVRVEEQETEEVPSINEVQHFITYARNNPKLFKEKKFENNISSFNFSERVFYDKVWNSLTKKARGLFINTRENKVILRGYDKFFSILERRETEWDSLRSKLQFPVTSYKKYNGFLGLLGVNNNELLFASKSTINSTFSNYFKNIFEQMYPSSDKIKDYIIKNNVTFVFEVIDPVNDPHIIEYDKPFIVLLDIIDNDLNYSKLPYEEMCKVAQSLGIKYYKEKLNTSLTFDEYYNFINDLVISSKWDNKYIEGVVSEDSTGYMIKAKTLYYNFWKEVRSYAQMLFTDKNIQNKEFIYDYNHLGSKVKTFINTLRDAGYEGPLDAIALRKMFEKI